MAHWRFIDFGFKVVGSIPLLICRILIDLENTRRLAGGGESFEP
jgi:hypothetical protein